MSGKAGKRPSVHRTSVGFAVYAAIILFLLLACYAVTWRSIAGFQVAIDTCARPFCDFAAFYYPMGEVVFQTALPLKGFVYSPFIAIVLSIFPALGFDASLVLWGILQAIAIVFYIILFRKLVPAGLPIQLLFIVLTLSSFPILHAFSWGQVGIFTTASILGALALYERSQRTLAAVLLAFGLSFKFFPIIFLAPFVFRRDIRFLSFIGVACAIFLFFIPYLFLGADNTLSFYSGLVEEYRNFDWVITNYNTQHFPNVFMRLGEALGMNAGDYLPFLRWISYGIAAINMGLVYLVQRAHLQHSNLWSFHIIFLTIPLVLLTSWPADLVYVSFAQGLLTWYRLEERKPPERTSWRNATLVLLLASIICSNIFFFNLIGDHERYGFIGFIFWSNLFLLAASYMELLPSALRQIRTILRGHVYPDMDGSAGVEVNDDKTR